MQQKDFPKRFHMRLSQAHLDALSSLRAKAGMRSDSEWLRDQIERSAKRKGLWRGK